MWGKRVRKEDTSITMRQMFMLVLAMDHPGIKIAEIAMRFEDFARAGQGEKPRKIRRPKKSNLAAIYRMRHVLVQRHMVRILSNGGTDVTQKGRIIANLWLKFLGVTVD